MGGGKPGNVGESDENIATPLLRVDAFLQYYALPGPDNVSYTT